MFTMRIIKFCRKILKTVCYSTTQSYILSCASQSLFFPFLFRNSFPISVYITLSFYLVLALLPVNIFHFYLHLLFLIFIFSTCFSLSFFFNFDTFFCLYNYCTFSDGFNMGQEEGMPIRKMDPVSSIIENIFRSKTSCVNLNCLLINILQNLFYNNVMILLFCRLNLRV